MEFMVDKKNTPVIVVGDFNEVLDKRVDRFPPGLQLNKVAEGWLYQFLEEAGLFDMWRVRNPNAQQYSCFSSSYSTLSRLDMALGKRVSITAGKKHNILTKRGVGSFASGVNSEPGGGEEPPGVWKISPFWLELMGKPEEVVLKLKGFVEFNEGTATTGVLLDTLKAFLRGILIQQVVKVKKKSREWEESIRKEVIRISKCGESKPGEAMIMVK